MKITINCPKCEKNSYFIFDPTSETLIPKIWYCEHCLGVALAILIGKIEIDDMKGRSGGVLPLIKIL